MRMEEFFCSCGSERCSGLGKKHMAVWVCKDGKGTEYHNFVRGSYTGLYFSTISVHFSLSVKKIYICTPL
jgi:hypothetical protein